MSEEHPNLALLQRLDPRNLTSSAGLFTEDVVWHFFNPKLPDIQGDYVGLAGIGSFFEKLGARTSGTFKVEPISVRAVGDELVVMHTRNTMVLEDEDVATDVVVVWRIVDGRIAEIWDIPSVYTTANPG
ncbi:MAG: nuclear transport factor 2 family protein [Pseudomonadota bacterium]